MYSPPPCPRCGSQVRPGARFCPRCGHGLPAVSANMVQCSNCGQPNRRDARYCAYCRTVLAPPPLVPPVPYAPRGRSRWMWVVASVGLLLIVAGSTWTLIAAGTALSSPPDATPTIDTAALAPTATPTREVETPTSTPTPTTEAKPVPVGVDPGEKAPDFVLDDLEGKAHRLSDYRGQVIILDFWATWCGYCQQQLPILQAVSDKYASQGVTVLAVDLEESEDKVTSYRSSSGIALTMLLDIHGQVGTDYRVRYLPTLYFIEHDGVIHSTRSGLMEQAEVEAEVETLLAKAPSP